MIQTWNDQCQAQALAQGWGIFAIDGHQDNLAIQRNDESMLLKDDLTAIMRVMENALEEDDPLAILAMKTVFYFDGIDFPYCDECGLPFTLKEWEDRHTSVKDGVSDIHGRCCKKCELEDLLPDAGETKLTSAFSTDLANNVAQSAGSGVTPV